jgi:arylsulfatase A
MDSSGRTGASSWTAQCHWISFLLDLFLPTFLLFHMPQFVLAAENSKAASRRPNVVFVLADDLGYGDLGCFGQKTIRTPYLDRLAGEGMRLTQHYSGNAVCAPSRCVLMTGLHPGHAFIRNNREVKPEGQFPIPASTVTLGKLLQAQGYVTGAFGKWGLGGPESEGRPLKQGINRFFGYNCQGVAHNFYPTSLWDDEKRFPLNNPAFSAHQPKLAAGVDPLDPASYAGYSGQEYSADIITEQALKFVRDNRERPFFLYVPTTIPHLALQAPDEAIKEYAAAIPDDPPYVGGNGYLPHRTPRAAYAAMVTRMDQHVGKIVSLVRELGLDDQTIYIFSSDNGPLYDKLGGTDCEFFESAGRLRGRKGSLYEGGFREPTVVRWKGHIPAGSVSDRVTGFEDWIPTILEMVGAREAIPKGLDGISFAPTLLGREQPAREFLYREFPAYGGQVSLRMGDWKGVVQNLMAQGKRPAQPWKIELYNLKDDVSESKDVAADHPEIVAKIDRLMREQHTPSVEFPFPALDKRR